MPILCGNLIKKSRFPQKTKYFHIIHTASKKFFLPLPQNNFYKPLKSKMQTVLSGIRPTGDLHLGNYFGALRNFVRLQNDYNCFFFVADYHSLTTHPHPADIQNNVRKILSQYIASGLDPEKSTIYIQSDLVETAEFYMLMNMNAYIGELERVVSFKEKARQNPDNVNAGLLTYAVLMACDILIQRADLVPVGKDQEQHLEMTCKFARRFNNIYGVEYFKEPKAFSFGDHLVKVPGLDGSGKMGKSEGNGIYLIDSDKDIRKKVMKAVTDLGPQAPNSEKPEVIQNLFTLMELVSDKIYFRPQDERLPRKASFDLISERIGLYANWQTTKELSMELSAGVNYPFYGRIRAVNDSHIYMKLKANPKPFVQLKVNYSLAKKNQKERK